MSAKNDTKRSAARRNGYSLHDQELLSAKNADRAVRIVLGQSSYFTDEDGLLICKIDKVDKYAIRILTTSLDGIWLTKQGILSTEVLR